MLPSELARSNTEHSHQRAFIAWLGKAYPAIRSRTTAIPLGRKRNAIDAAVLKAEGATAGWPDIVISMPTNRFHGMFIEFKRPETAKKRAGTVGKQQNPIHVRLLADNYFVVVCDNWRAAAQAVQWYVGIDAWNDVVDR